MITGHTADYDSLSESRETRYDFEQMRRDKAETRSRRTRIAIAVAAGVIKLAGLTASMVEHDPRIVATVAPISIAGATAAYRTDKSRKQNELRAPINNMDYLALRQRVDADNHKVEPPEWAAAHQIVTITTEYIPLNLTYAEVVAEVESYRYPALDS